MALLGEKLDDYLGSGLALTQSIISQAGMRKIHNSAVILRSHRRPSAAVDKNADAQRRLWQSAERLEGWPHGLLPQ